MHRVKLLTIALLGILALSATALAATSSAALPELLPEGTATEPVHFKIEHDNTGTLETLSGKTLSCKKLSGKGLIEKLKLGTIELLFEGCESAATACTGLNKGEESGKIKTAGTFHSWYGLLEKN